ncbi:RHS repeat-associated core domain-containing protein [Simiduia agarivorans]|nr:RHS repeat-associated core domain-containing protein [Simiduia agarivorans]
MNVGFINSLKQSCIGLFLLIGLGLLSGTAAAAPGIHEQQNMPSAMDGFNQDEFQDMVVTAQGGNVRLTRRWQYNQWVWNPRWEDLKFLRRRSTLLEYFKTGEYSYEEFKQSLEISYGNVGTSGASIPVAQYTIVVARDMYVPRGTDQWENQQRFTIARNSDKTFTWRDREGNEARYSETGVLQWYTDASGNKVSLSYNSDGNLQYVKDVDGTVLFEYHWQALPLPDGEPAEGEETPTPQYQLTSVSDYQGRSVHYAYNPDSGLLEQVTDVNGNLWRYQYGGNNLQKIIDPLERETSVAISAQGQLIRRVNQDGVGQYFSYSRNADEELFTLSVRDGAGTVTETVYNGFGMPERKERQGDLLFTAEYVLNSDKDVYFGQGRAPGVAAAARTYAPSSGGGGGGKGGVSGSVSMGSPEPDYVEIGVRKYPDGSEEKTTYDRWRNPLKQEYKDGSVTTTSYNNRSQPLLHTNTRGIKTRYAYDAKGNLLTLIEAEGLPEERTTRYEYNAASQLIKLTTGESAAGNTALAVTQWDYDDFGNVTKITDPLGHETLYTDYNALGQWRTMTDANGKVWTRTYDNAGNLLTETTPEQSVTQYQYDAAGQMVSIILPSERSFTITYNASGMPLTVTDNNGNRQLLTYDAANRLTKVTDPSNHSHQLVFDEQGRLARQIDGEGNATQFSYEHQLLKTVATPGYTVTQSYDQRRRPVSETISAATINQNRATQYDKNGNPVQWTDANGKGSGAQYDGLGRLVASTDTAGHTTRYAYDARDNLLSVTDAENRTTYFTYTLRDEVASETKPAYVGTEMQRRYQYDGNGNLIQVLTPEQERLVYAYDGQNRLTRRQVFAHKDREHPVKVVTYHYNAKQQYAGYTQAAGADTERLTVDIIALSESISYDSNDRISSVTVSLGGFSKSYGYTYYPNGQKKTYTNPEGVTYSYQYNKNSQLTGVEIPGEGQIAWANHQWLAPQLQLLPGGARINSQYDGLLRLKEREFRDAAHKLLGSAGYSFDAESNITAIDTEHGRYSFGYDDAYRLTDADYNAQAEAPEAQATNPNPPAANPFAAEAFSYDGVGNRLTRARGGENLSYSYNNHNQLTAISGDRAESFTYNANGHTVNHVAAGISTDYRFNAEERLIAVEKNSAVVGRYAYNPYGQRIYKYAGGQATWFVYNDTGLAAEYDASGALIKEYHFHPQSTWMTEPLFQRVDGQVYYYQNDHLGTPQKIIGKNGALVWEGRWSAFGELAVVDGATVENLLRFPGQYGDEESGLYQNYFRDYWSGLGRYLQEDPIGLRGGVNFYGYVGGRPLIFIDPLGLNNVRPPNRWNQFQRRVSGQGLTRTEVRQAYQQYLSQLRQGQLKKLGGPRNPELHNMLSELPDEMPDAFKEALDRMDCNSFGTCEFLDLVCECDGPKYCPSGPEMKVMSEDDENCYCYYVTRTINT